MTPLTRSDFLRMAGGGIAGLALTSRTTAANPLGLPVGIQPYTVRNDLQADFMGTLRKLAAMGYREIEVSGGEEYGDFFGRKAAEVKKALDESGLRAPSCHFGAPKDDAGWARNLEDAHTLGLEYVLSTTRREWRDSADGWKRTGEFFNHLAEQARAAGFGFAYHNHNWEYRLVEGVMGYDRMLAASDPKLVKMEMDCFWTVFAGQDPAAYMKRYPGRIVMLHIKDLKKGFAPTTGHFEGNPFAEVGSGVIDWTRVFQAAKQAGVKHYYVEQDNWDRPSLESARMSIEYLKKLRV